MADGDRDDFTPQEKAFDLAWRLAGGEQFTTADVAQDYGMTWRGAYRLIMTGSRVMPLFQNSTGVWRAFDNE